MQEHSIATKMVLFVCLIGLEQGVTIVREGCGLWELNGEMNLKAQSQKWESSWLIGSRPV
jgi:hypothetical protein